LVRRGTRRQGEKFSFLKRFKMNGHILTLPPDSPPERGGLGRGDLSLNHRPPHPAPLPALVAEREKNGGSVQVRPGRNNRVVLA